MNKIISKINLRQILFYIVGIICIIFSFKNIALLFDTELLELIDKNGLEKTWSILADKGSVEDKIADFYIRDSIAAISGIIIGLLFSLYISVKKNGWWINSLIILISILIIFRLISFDEVLLKPLSFFGNKIFSEKVFYRILFNGIMYLIIAIMIYFYPRIQSITYKDKK